MPYVNKEKAKEYARIWARKYRENNREKVNKRAVEYYYKVKDTPGWKEKHCEQTKKYYQKNREKMIDYQTNIVRFGGNKHKVFERDKNRCQICSIEKVNKNILIHHIDGNGRGSKKPNNDINNLILLCQGCHSIVHKFNKVKNNPLFKKLTDSL